MTTKIEQEQLLLRRCNEDDPRALAVFAELSYINEVCRGVYEANSESFELLDPMEEEEVVTVCIGEIYKNWQYLPVAGCPLRRRIREYAFVFGVKYIREKKQIEETG